MAGRFTGLTDQQWELLKPLLPPPPAQPRRGMPHAPFRHILNTQLYILITGSRWCDVPQGPQWGSKSSAHRWLKRWQSDGTWSRVQSRILGMADNHQLINWDYGAIDGSFSAGKGEVMASLTASKAKVS